MLFTIGYRTQRAIILIENHFFFSVLINTIVSVFLFVIFHGTKTYLFFPKYVELV